MKIAVYLISILGFLGNLSFAQELIFQKKWGSANYDSGRDMIILNNNDILITGITSSSLSDSDVYVARFNSSGTEIWSKTFGGAKNDFAWTIIPSPDGNFLICGSTESIGNGGLDIYLLKIDPNGNKIWEKTYGTAGRDGGKEVRITPDGGMIIAGFMNIPPDSEFFKYCLIKTDKDGNQQWMKQYARTENDGFDGGASVKCTPDGGYVLFGQTYTVFGDPNIYLLKTDQNGNELWSKVINSVGYDRGQYVYVNSDGTLMTIGDQSENTNGDVDINVRKWDPNGNILWSKLYGGTDKDVGKKIIPGFEDGYILAGHTRSFGLIDPDMYIIKIDSNGNQLWTKHFGGTNHEHCYAAMEVNKEELLALGHTISYSGNEVPNFYMVKDHLPQKPPVVGIPTEQLLASVNIYPNPVKDRLVISGLTANNTNLSLTDISGRVVAEEKIEQAEEVNVPLQGLAKGLYVLQLSNREGVLTKKIIID